MLARKLIAHHRPRLRLIAPMTDDETDRLTPTDVAPPPSERHTQPPDPIAEAGVVKHLNTMLPGSPLAAVLTPIEESATNQLLRIHHDVRGAQRDILDPDGPFAKAADRRAQRMKEETVRELAAIVDRLAGAPVRDLSAKVERLGDVVSRVRDDVANIRPRVDSIETEQAALRAELSRLRERADADRIEYQKKFEDQDACLKAVTDTLDQLEKSR